MSYKLPSVIEIEITPDKNRRLLSCFTMSKLRGRYRAALLTAKGTSRPLGQMPDVPGMRLLLNLEQRVLTVFDPLGEDKNKELLARVKKVYKEEFNQEIGPEAPVNYRDLDNDQIKTILNEWAVWCRKGKVTVEQGPLPTVEEIRELPGRVQINQFNSDPRAPKFAEAMPPLGGRQAQQPAA